MDGVGRIQSEARVEVETSAQSTSPDGQSSSHAGDTTPTGSRHDSIQDPSSEAKSRDFYCEKCDISFTEKRALLRHQRESEKHKGGDPNASRVHQCSECGKSYKRAHDLRRHLDEVHRAKRRRRNAGDDAAGPATGSPEEDDPIGTATYTVPIVTQNAGPLGTTEEQLEVVRQTALNPAAVPGFFIPTDLSGLVDPVAFVDGTEEADAAWPSSSTQPQNSLAILRSAYTSQKHPTARNRSMDPANQLAQNTRFSKDHEVINLAPETRQWLSSQLSNQAEFSVAAFNARDFAFQSEKFKSINDTLAPDLKFSHHKLPLPFNHQQMIGAYNMMAKMNPAWNIKVLGASPIINLRDKTATIFISSLVTDDGVAWAEQVIEYKFRLYSSRWLSYHVTSMRGQRLLGG